MSDSNTEKDRFLHLIQRRKKGRLKIYIGMIAGVGKTYRMLQEAHQLLAAGVDVRIGLIETHGREETHALVEGVPQIPLKKVFYKGRELEEMDPDAIILSRPDVVLVDELAHTNIPGCKNKKRWQDVEELLNYGINVITAFNVQHLQSMTDKVEDISGVEIKETIPDSILNEADEVVNIDLPAEDLIKRLNEGKIYKGERIGRALNNFFQPEKILQLRDLALRKVASQVEKKIESSLPAASRMQLERFMACISTNAESGRHIIRKTARMAGYYHAEWFVVYIKTPRKDVFKIDLKTQRKLLNNMQLARELGAQVMTIREDNISRAVFQKAVDLKITNIVMGKPHFSLWRQLRGKNHFDKLLKCLRDTEIDVIIVF
ncbi:sensor protein KdpD [Sinomicrobium weinanense]|uniref:Sensor protein KdpD n=1 Tax=Sinomicrobium weinanense TaxID=2842200 RepID=A0A926JWU8_9FLAO|nr:sensor protein KdpD [Sinomicrobium weinanense]MBC9798642.1 sensor protein KdpD [Sinomicrobium weinanense]MBU3122363.1 sensor protein KdpD [Sinomicrobium weinanense]